MSSSRHAHRTWIKVQELDRDVEDFADLPARWVDKFVLRSTITPNGGSESVVAGRSTSTFSHLVECRNPASMYPIPFKQSMRILVDDEIETCDENKRAFYIESVDASDDRRTIEMQVTERLDA